MLQNHPNHLSSPNTTTKWVTFNDMVDDAMEGGKLRNNKNNYNLSRRRASMMEMPAQSAQVMTGSCSTQDFTSLKYRPWNSVMFSSSMDSRRRSQPGDLPNEAGLPARTPQDTSCSQQEDPSELNSANDEIGGSAVALQLPKPPETHPNRQTRRTPRLSALSSTLTRNSVSSMSTSGTYDDDEDDEDDRGSVSSGGDRPFSQSFGGIGNKDKYSVFTGLKKPGQGYTGWSTQVMGTGPFGWSDELLNGDTVAGNPTAPADGLEEQQEQPWYKGHRATTWNTSPSRSFLRNFP